MKKWINRRTFLTTSVAAVLGSEFLINSHPSMAQSVSENFKGIRQTIKQTVETGSPKSIVIAVAKEGKIIWEEAFGLANREKRIPASINTRYAISSVSKTFTATGLMVLVEKGLIRLDDPISKFLGNMQLTAYAGNVSSVTVKHLLQHTSGLPRHWRNFYTDEKDLAPSLQETIKRYGFITTVPGEHYNYSNLNYALLSFIIEKVSGLSFAAFMQRKVFLPLGLIETTIENNHILSRPAASLYNSDGTLESYYTVDESGSQRVFSTARDLIKFGLFHLKNLQSGQKQIIKPELIDQMAQEKQSMEISEDLSLCSALGWITQEKSKYNYYNLAQSGDAPGVSAQLMILPNEKIAVAVISNTRSADLIYTITDDVLDCLLPDNKKMRESNPAFKPPLAETSFKPTTELLGEWSGEIKTYSGTLPATMIFQSDGDVHLKLEGQLETLVSNIRFENGKLSGRCQGTIPTGDALRRPHQLRFVLLQKNNLLSGTIHAQASKDSQAPNSPKRDYFALASWIKLTKK